MNETDDSPVPRGELLLACRHLLAAISKASIPPPEALSDDREKAAAQLYLASSVSEFMHGALLPLEVILRAISHGVEGETAEQRDVRAANAPSWAALAGEFGRGAVCLGPFAMLGLPEDTEVALQMVRTVNELTAYACMSRTGNGSKAHRRHGMDTLVAQLLSDVDQPLPSNERGRVLEDLLVRLLESISGFTVESRVRTQTEEIDIAVVNNSANPLWAKDGPIILCECKNWSGKCGKDELVLFEKKLQNRKGRCKLGILVSWNGFAGTVSKELLRSSEGDTVIVLVTSKELRTVLAGESFESILERCWKDSVMS